MYIYAWDNSGTQLLGGWSGLIVTAGADGWYSHTFEDIPLVNVILNNGTLQTVDIENVTQSTCYEILNEKVGNNYKVRAIDCNYVPVQSVSLNKNSTTLAVDATEQLTPTVAPANATNQSVTWSSSNTAIATVTNGLVKGISQGQATITVKTDDGNKTATCTVTVSGATGIEDVLASQITIYPNPVKEELFIESELTIKKIEICDIAGKTLSTHTTNTINVSHLPQGVYLVKIHTDKGVVTQKVVKN